METHVGTHERNSGQQTEIKHRLDRGNIGNLQEKHKHIKNRVEANGKTQRKGTAQTKQQANKNTALKGKAPAIPARGPVYSLTWYRPSTNTQAATRQLFKPHPSAAMDGTISIPRRGQAQTNYMDHFDEMASLVLSGKTVLILIAVMASPIVSCLMACLAIATYILHEPIYREHGACSGNARDSPQTDSKVRPPPHPADHAKPEEEDGNEMKTSRISLYDKPITQQKQAEGIHPPHSPSAPPATSIHGHPASNIYTPVEQPSPKEEMTMDPQALPHYSNTTRCGQRKTPQETESHTTKNQDGPKKSQSRDKMPKDSIQQHKDGNDQHDQHTSRTGG